MTTRKVLYFTAPKQVEVREEPLPALGNDDVLVETLYSAISAGTEMLIYRGEFPRIEDAHDSVSSDLKYPLAYGYACVGVIRETGKQVNKSLLNKLVFAFHAHASSFIVSTSLNASLHATSLFFLPDFISPITACFLPNMETAVNLVQDAAPILGERVLVLGQGIIGLLTTALLREFPLDELVTADFYELRRKAAKDLNVNAVLNPQGNFSNESVPKKFDLTFELSGSPAALNDAIRFTTFSGRIVIGSWYGEKRAPLDLGGDFHHSRIKLISSQVSTIAPELSGRWDKSRRFEVAWQALERIKPEKWVTQRFSLNDAAKAYQLLDEHPEETIQVLLEYPR
jgi:2-desacetyl-2-hydroxyethyl bacteriochlorophyllide A dehydrogenase